MMKQLQSIIMNMIALPATKSLPPDSAWLFPEYDVETIDLHSYQGVIIERILEKGSWDQIHWLFTQYGEKKVKQWVQKHGLRLLSNRSFAFWRLVLGIKRIQTPAWLREAHKAALW
ncbi:MAG: hypothetical protein L0Y56_13210 [Nitrospira sp.]|nr:hypothetical protein [Nitrospira sp.]